MSSLQMTYALILLVSVATLLVNGGPSKRNLRNAPNPGRPRTEEPICREICANITSLCERNCYPPNGNARYTTTFPGGTTTAGFVDRRKFECLDKCIDEEEEPIVFEEEGCSMVPEIIQPQEEDVTPKPTEEAEIDVTALTMADRCHMEGWVNSTVCEFDRKFPIVSRKVFDVNKPKLTLCPGSPVVSGKNGFSLKKSFSQQHAQNTATLTRKVRSVLKDPPADVDDIIIEKHDRKDVPISWHDGDEFCSTLLAYESPRSAIHLTTQHSIDIYFYAGYSQWFLLGDCESKVPKRSISESINSRCDIARTMVKAWVVVDPKKFPEPKKVKNCGTVKHVPYLVCNDWVLLATHCKHYF